MPAFPGDPSTPAPRLNVRAVTYVCGLFLLSRLLVLTVAALSRLAVMQGPFSNPAHTWIERFDLWDADWYLSIAQRGYDYHPDGASSVGFYPLYPMLIRGASLLGLDMRLAGYAISHVTLLAAALLLWKLAARETGSASVADRSVMFLLFCPGAVWFGMIYTESLFLLTLLGCLLCARQGRWITAGAWGLLAALTRTPGLLLAGFLFLEAVQQWWDHRRADPDDAPFWRRKAAGLPWWSRVTLGIAGPVAGNLAYLVFLQVRFGTWRAQQITMNAGWKHGSGTHLPWTALALQWQANERHLMAVSTPLLAITLGLALIGLFTLKHVGYCALIFALAMLCLGTPGDAMTRYLSTLAPAYIVLAQLAERSRLLDAAALVFSVGLMALTTVLVVNGCHVA